MNESCHTSHRWNTRHTAHRLDGSHVTHVRESWPTYKLAMSYITQLEHMSHHKRTEWSCHTWMSHGIQYDWVMSHKTQPKHTSHNTRTDWVMSHRNKSWHTSWHTYNAVMSHETAGTHVTPHANGMGWIQAKYAQRMQVIRSTHCNSLQRTAIHSNALQRTATHCNALQCTATHCNALQHTATHY